MFNLFVTLGLDPGESLLISALLLIVWAVIAVICGRYGREIGYSFWLCFLLCLLGQFVGLIVVLLLPDIARIRADAAGRARGQDQEIAALKARLAALENKEPAADSPEETPSAAAPPDSDVPLASPAIFPARTEDMIACPRCGRRQKGNRDACYACGLPFQYENE